MRKMSMGMMWTVAALMLAACQHRPDAAARPARAPQDNPPTPARDPAVAEQSADPAHAGLRDAMRDDVPPDTMERVLDREHWNWVRTDDYVNGIILEEYRAQWHWKLPAGSTAKVEGYVANDGLKARILFELPFYLPR